MLYLPLSPRCRPIVAARFFAALFAIAAFPAAVSAASNFTYQGRLNASGGPATGAHDFEFGLYGSTSGADQVGTTVTVTGVIVSGGLFSVQLDFGDAAFDSPSRYLEILVRPQGNGAYTPLSPRQVVTPAPAAHHAFSIANGSVTAAKMATGSVSGGTGGTVMDASITGQDLALGAVGSGNLSTTVGQALVPAGSYIMTTSNTAPPGYTFAGMTVSPAVNGGWDQSKASMPTARSALAAAAINNKIYALGGINGYTTNEEYDPATNTWTARAPMLTPNFSHAAVAVNGLIYVLGGRNGSPLSVNESYDPVTNTWTVKSSMPTARWGVAAAVSNGKIYAVGGFNSSSGILATNEEYNPATDSWTAKAPMLTARESLAAAAAPNGKVYALGGGTSSGTTAANEEYDPVANSWTAKASMPPERVYFAAAVTNGKIYVLGGSSNSGILASNFEYNPMTDIWIEKAVMPTARLNLAAAMANDKIYAIGGENSIFNPPFSNNEEYTVPGAPSVGFFYIHRKD